jgi:hypothetical protein
MEPTLSRNPPWERDELILALDLYFRCDPVHTSEKNPEIIKLSQLLSQLATHPYRKAGPSALPQPQRRAHEGL